MSNQRSNTVMVGLVAALIVPRIEQTTGIKLTIDDVAALIALAGVAWHGLATAFERYLPPPNPQKPVEPAKVNS
jgi:hypothetical protein